jgi:DNA-binding NarL/FixJ family response regulator
MNWEEAVEYALATVDLVATLMQEQPSTHTAHASELTAREIEVLRLVASGLTDAQVAEKLVISTRTVNSHLSSIYSKLGVNTRTAAVRAAHDHHLL